MIFHENPLLDVAKLSSAAVMISALRVDKLIKHHLKYAADVNPAAIGPDLDPNCIQAFWQYIVAILRQYCSNIAATVSGNIVAILLQYWIWHAN